MSFILGPNDRQQRCEKHYDSWKEQRHRKNQKIRLFSPFFSSENNNTPKHQKSKVKSGDAVVENNNILIMANTNSNKGEREYKQVPLFGNCVTTLIPLEWLDVSDYRPVPDNQEMFSDFNSLEPSMMCVEIVERVGDDVTGVHSQKFREEDNLAKFYLEDLKELMDIATRDDDDSHSKTIRTKDWRYELSSGRKVHSDLRAIFVDGKNEDAKKEAMKKMEDLSLTLPKEDDDGEEEREGKPKKENDDDVNDDYVKNKCEWISFAEEKNCLVPSKENQEGKDSTRLVTISMYVHRLEKKYETDILVSFVRPSSKSDDANHRVIAEDEIQEQNNPGTVAHQTLRMLDWSLLGLDDSEDVNDDDDDEEGLE